MHEVRRNNLPRPINELLAFRHDRVLDRYVKDFGSDRERFEARFLGFKQFMAVCGVMSGPKITSDAIDTVWHTFLLFTRDYDAFCREYVGRFVHHEPFETPNPGAYVETRRVAEDLFGALDETIWPASAKGDCSSGCCRD